VDQHAADVLTGCRPGGTADRPKNQRTLDLYSSCLNLRAMSPLEARPYYLFVFEFVIRTEPLPGDNVDRPFCRSFERA
jgi:hypothetical protein